MGINNFLRYVKKHLVEVMEPDDEPEEVAPPRPDCVVVEMRQEVLVGNLIFRRYRDGRAVDMEKLRLWIDDNFVCRVNFSYEWLALWRILVDEGFIDSGRTKASEFERQMRGWYPQAPCPCDSGALRLYRYGYLGDKPFRAWDEEEFRLKMQKKQTVKGFRRLYGLCTDLTEGLRATDFRA